MVRGKRGGRVNRLRQMWRHFLIFSVFRKKNRRMPQRSI